MARIYYKRRRDQGVIWLGSGHSAERLGFDEMFSRVNEILTERVFGYASGAGIQVKNPRKSELHVPEAGPELC